MRVEAARGAMAVDGPGTPLMHEPVTFPPKRKSKMRPIPLIPLQLPSRVPFGHYNATCDCS